ncbi:hypothetical protein BH09SUM1_BH09SUM1_12300 [soil metagenome]
MPVTTTRFIASAMLLAAFSGCTKIEKASASSTPAPVAKAVDPKQAEFDAEVARLVDKYGERLTRSRYMEQGTPKDVTMPGWEGFPLKRYSYTLTDKTSGVIKHADVVLLDAPPEKVARWIVHTVVVVKGDVDPISEDKIFDRILGQSGGQFPVAGVVYEDIIPEDGVNEIYCFRDGVTVKIDGIQHRGTAPMTPEDIERSINGKVTWVFRYGRIQSTSPSEYTRNGGTVDVGTDKESKPAWMDVIRESYKSAWNSDENTLMIAWARQGLNAPQ